jgi:signal transduction histidine kinase
MSEQAAPHRSAERLARSLPVAAAVALTVVFIATARTPHPNIFDAAWGGPILGALCVTISLALGMMTSWRLSLVAMLAVAAAITVNGQLGNTLLPALAVGPWLCGLLLGSQRRFAMELRARTRELEVERNLLAMHAVRYERAQIARELHDVVAHSVSLIVVQANAGVYTTASDPVAAAEGFEVIAEIATQVRAEVEQLTAVLQDGASPPEIGGVRVIESLVRRAETSGLMATCQFTGDLSTIPSGLSDVLLRLAQESITNAVKHAPGAPIRIALHGTGSSIEFEVINESPTSAPSGLEHLGGGRGLAGMRERVRDMGGTFSAGPTADHGWMVSALLPRRQRHTLAEALA